MAGYLLVFRVLPNREFSIPTLQGFAFSCRSVWTFLSVMFGLSHCAVNQAVGDLVAGRISDDMLPHL